MNGWIPVTERLPEQFDSCLVTVEGSEGGRVFDRAVDYADFDENGGYIDNFNTVNDWIEHGEWHVTAWMPLPKPYEKQPELLTDNEKRLFLSAMAREETVCRELNKEMPDTLGLVDLIRVCKEIERKVKSVLW